jgi:hypothetical protein
MIYRDACEEKSESGQSRKDDDLFPTHENLLRLLLKDKTRCTNHEPHSTQRTEETLDGKRTLYSVSCPSSVASVVRLEILRESDFQGKVNDKRYTISRIL